MTNRDIFFKIQYFNPTSITWIDLQQRFATEIDADNAADKTKKYRFMMVDGKKRTVIDPASLSE